MSGSIAEMDSEFSLTARANVASIQKYVPDATVDQYGQHFGHDFDELIRVHPRKSSGEVYQFLGDYITNEVPLDTVVRWAKDLGIPDECEEWLLRASVAEKVIGRLRL